MTEDFRRLKRRIVEIKIDVVDCMTQQTIGQIVNISELGMMITTCNMLTPDGLYQFKLCFPKTMDFANTVGVGAHELWAEYNQQTGQMEAGFRFIDISANDRIWLRDWINSSGSLYA
jgi:hypothetical protein